jgi:hypothetical protein
VRPSKFPASRSSRPVLQWLAAIAAVGVAAFYGGYRYGLKRAARDAPRAAAAHRANDRPATTPANGAAKDVHFQPRNVTATSGNFLANPGFEDGDAGWRWLDWSQEWGPFEIGTARVASGTKAAHIPAHGGPLDRPTRVFGVVQEIVSAKFPSRISGSYFVDRWEPGGAKKAYIQVVIIAMRSQGSEPTMQLRYILDGVTEPPYRMSNARYVFVRKRAQPETGKWIDFQLDLAADYRRLWGEIPPDGTGYRVLFEARYDDKPAGGTVTDDVWYDDLFVGVP